jgi:hypothetical protein
MYYRLSNLAVMNYWLTVEVALTSRSYSWWTPICSIKPLIPYARLVEDVLRLATMSFSACDLWWEQRALLFAMGRTMWAVDSVDKTKWQGVAGCSTACQSKSNEYLLSIPTHGTGLEGKFTHFNSIILTSFIPNNQTHWDSLSLGRKQTNLSMLTLMRRWYSHSSHQHVLTLSFSSRHSAGSMPCISPEPIVISR